MVEFKCSACGDCCRGFSDDRRVIVFPVDLDPLANKLGISKRELANKYLFEEVLEVAPNNEVKVNYIRPEGNGDCPFLGLENECTVHDSKPEQCKRTPFGFAWAGARIHECMLGVEVPIGFNTDEADRQIFSSLNDGYKFD